MDDILIIVLDVATFFIPPILPAVLTSVNVHAQRRLKKKGIFCLNSQAISSAGEIDVMCFDKTGTLTEDAIDFMGVLPNLNANFGPMIENVNKLPSDSIIVKTMASCHSLVEYQNHLEGDDLELKLFHASKWNLIQNIDDNLLESFERIPDRIVTNNLTDSNYQMIGIIKQYPFESFLQRMLVIIKDVKTNQFISMVKGAPEVIKSLCLVNTLPENYDNILEKYTCDGYRVLASATKILPMTNVDTYLNMNRNELESKMKFDCFYLFKNKLKSSSSDIIKELIDANIRCLMITGDNMLTAINVAQECNMVQKKDSIIKVSATIDKLTNKLIIEYNYVKYADFQFFQPTTNNGDIEANGIDNWSYIHHHLAIDGLSFGLIKNFQPDLIEKIAHRGTIFARMTPGQKLDLIKILRRQEHSVGMCGDGANDCGALRAADAGISLSVAEASVASPFTYKNNDISCVPLLIKEGRCTLVSISGAFKYQITYCFILLSAAMILFWYGFKPSDGTYVYVDVLINILPPIVFATTEPYPKLSKRLPIRNQLSLVPQLSIYLFIILQSVFYYFSHYLLINQSWYKHVDNNDINNPLPNQLSFVIFSSNTMSYVIAAIIFAPGPPYRKGFFSNSKLNLKL